MGKSDYLKYFQKNLRDYIQNLVCDDWGYTELLITEEDGNLQGCFNGYMDISICNPDKENIVLGIEIEHLGEFHHAKQNINKLKTWTHNSINRSCSMLHIFNEECKISHDKIGELVRYARENQMKNHGFFYDYIFYSVDNLKTTRQKPEEIVNSLEFKTRLWMLIEDCGLI